MNAPLPIYLAVEDELSEHVLRRLLKERPVPYAIGPVLQRGGFGYLKKQAPAFNNMARSVPVLLLTDLDNHTCAPALISEWLAGSRHPDFLLRVAVREVESWLLAADSGLSSYIGVGSSRLHDAPEVLPDPKMELLKLVWSCPRREKREAIVRRDSNGKLLQGPAYNAMLGEFVYQGWQVKNAAKACPSLKRLIVALAALEHAWIGKRD